MKLGVLDIGGDLGASVELAPLADELGYTRYWIAEHQPQPSPILIASILAGITERIRIGTAGILLHYYPPLKTAHDFHFLERAYTDRIDAGFCGGITPHPHLLADDVDGRSLPQIISQYEQRAGRLIHHLRNTPANPGFDRDTAWMGVPDRPPQIWSLGGGGRSATLAIEHGLAFGYALMFTSSRDEPEVAAMYREKFSPRGDLEQPLVAVAVAGICAETDAEAQRIRADYTGKFFDPRIVGGPGTCIAALEALRARYGADEIVFADLCPTLDARLACYRLLAQAGF